MMEMLLAVVLISVLLYGLGTLITVASSQNETLTNRIQSEAEINEMSFYLKHILSMGINVEYLQNTNLNNAAGSGAYENIGWVRGDYDFSPTFVAATAAASIETIGFFLRDNLLSDSAAVPSVGDRFLPTGIYFQRPTPKTYGILYFDLGRSQAAGTVAISPSRDDLWYGSVVDFKALEPEFTTFDVNSPDMDQSTAVRRRLSAVTFKVTVREYLPKPNSPHDYTWCPPDSMADPLCQTTSPYKDVERVVRVVFRNNILGYSPTQMKLSSEPPPALQVKSVRRALYRRPFDLVYFLKPAYPSGQLKRY